jgi:hypothetical protein
LRGVKACQAPLNSHYGLWFELAYDPDANGPSQPLGSPRAFVFDEVVNAASAQYI